MKILDKIKQQPAPVKLLAGVFLFWVYPFIESMIVGAGGFYDLSILAIVLLFLGGIIFGYLAITTFFIPVGMWIGRLFKKITGK